MPIALFSGESNKDSSAVLGQSSECLHGVLEPIKLYCNTFLLQKLSKKVTDIYIYYRIIKHFFGTETVLQDFYVKVK